MAAASRLHARDASGAWCRHRVNQGTSGAEPSAPAAIASHNAGVRYQETENSVGAAIPKPNIALKNAAALPRVSARKKTQPIATTSRTYAWRSGAHSLVTADARPSRSTTRNAP